MNLADVFTVLFIILGFIIVFIAYWLMAAGLFPRFTESCAERIGRMPVRSALLGLVTLTPVIVVGLTVSNAAPNAPGKLAGLGIALAGALGALFGSAGLALRIGQGLKAARDEHDPWRRVLRGGIVLALTFVMPFLGTFLVMPFAFAAGFGAFLLAMFSRRSAQTAAAPEAVQATPPAFPAVP